MVPESPFSRVKTLESGRAMIVTDIHGDWDAYVRYRDRFLELKSAGSADVLIFTGDMIHSYGPPEQDHSLEIILDILQLKKSLGDALITLLGNHEVPHLYSIELRKGNLEFTARFEHAMGEHRRKILRLFNEMPIYIRTRAGVSICHTGGAATFLKPGGAATIFTLSHERIWQEAQTILPDENLKTARAAFQTRFGLNYDEEVYNLLAITSPKDRRYDDLLYGNAISSYHNDFQLLWETLFNKNEHQYRSIRYGLFLDALLRELGDEYTPQRYLVTGHIDCPANGHTIVSGKQLRIASGKHAHKQDARKYLLVDMGQPIENMRDLVTGLGSVY
jgi:hypothetical protein